MPQQMGEYGTARKADRQGSEGQKDASEGTGGIQFVLPSARQAESENCRPAIAGTGGMHFTVRRK